MVSCSFLSTRVCLLHHAKHATCITISNNMQDQKCGVHVHVRACTYVCVPVLFYAISLIHVQFVNLFTKQEDTHAHAPTGTQVHYITPTPTHTFMDVCKHLISYTHTQGTLTHMSVHTQHTHFSLKPYLAHKTPPYHSSCCYYYQARSKANITHY